MNTFLVRTSNSEHDGVKWFFIAAKDEETMRGMVVDSITTIEAVYSGQQEIAVAVKFWFDGVAMIHNV